jgi:hypothetical protein
MALASADAGAQDVPPRVTLDDGHRLVAQADAVYDARLQVGRVLSGRTLAWADLLRGLLVSLTTLGSTEGGAVAPAWVVVSRRDDGSEVARISAGREPGAGETLLDSVRTRLWAS